MEIILGLAAVGLWLLVTLVLPILSFVRASRALSDAAALRARLASIEAHLGELVAERKASDGATESAAAASKRVEAVPSRTVSAQDRGAVAPLIATTEPPPVGPMPVEDAPAPAAPASAPVWSAGVPPSVSDGSAGPGTVPPLPHVVTAETGAGGATAWEEAIGGRLLLYVGAVVLVLGAAFFLKYAFDREWITESMRVGLGAIGGAALVAAGLRIGRAGYGTYGQVLTGGGLAVLYLAAYAAFGFYALIGSTAAFVLLCGITVLAALLADRQESQPMALMALGGGFLTPFLVGGTTDAQATLFSYVAVLLLGTLYLARRRGWPMLHVLAYALTILTVAAWADAYYTRAKYLRTEIFLTVFCGLFLAALVHARRLATPAAPMIALVLATAPVLYHVASLGLLSPHGVAFLVYLIAFTVVGVGWAVHWARAEARVVLWMAVFLPLIPWIEVHQSRNWIAPSLVTLGAVFALHLLGQIDRITRQHASLSSMDVLLMHVNGLGLFLGAYVLLERQAVGSVPAIGVGLAVVHAALALWLRARDAQAGLHAVAVALALAAAAAGVQFDGAWLTAAWAVEGAAVLWIGLRIGSEWFRLAGAALLAVAAERWVVMSVLQPVPAGFRLFANEATAVGVLLVALLYALAWMHRQRTGVYPLSVAAFTVAASVVTIVLLTQQNYMFWEIRGATNADASFARQLVLSLIWACYAGLLITLGIRVPYAPIRYVAMVLFGMTVLKVFLVDLSGLEGIYRVLGLFAVGTILLLVSFLYQRRRRSDRQESEVASS